MMVMMQMAAAMPFLELDLGQRTVMMHWVAAMVLDSGHWTLELSCAGLWTLDMWIQKRELAATMLWLQSEAPPWKCATPGASTSHVQAERVWQHQQLGLDGATSLHASACWGHNDDVALELG